MAMVVSLMACCWTFQHKLLLISVVHIADIYRRSKNGREPSFAQFFKEPLFTYPSVTLSGCLQCGFSTRRDDREV